MDTNGQLAAGPYRATLLWNDLIRKFRAEIPLGRHRRYMRTYDDCFVASEAVDWLHQYLKKNPNFGSNVSKSQTVQLLQKLHRARVFEDVRGAKHNTGDFTDSGRLFKVTHSSPARAIRTPIALRNNLKLTNLRRSPEKRHSPPQTRLNFDKVAASMPNITEGSSSTLPECHFVSKPLSPQDIEEEWKTAALHNLKRVLDVETLDDILDSRLVSGRNIMHNCLYINKSGVVTNIEPADQLPHWVLSAMKCLAYWPDKIDANLPAYPGFEKDVYRVVKDYFCTLPEPLMTFDMYEVITNVFVTAETGQLPRQSTLNLCDNSSIPKQLINFKSVENLLLNLTHLRQLSPECQDTSSGYSSTNILDLSPIAPTNDNIRGFRVRSPGDDIQPVTGYETVFGPDNKTVTRVYYADGISTDYDHGRDKEGDEEHTPIETHFETSPTGSEGGRFDRQTSMRRSMQSVLSRGKSVIEKRCQKERFVNRRRTMGSSFSDNRTYGCTVGVYSKSSSETPVSSLSQERISQDMGSKSTEDIPRCTERPPRYEALYPESMYPSSHHPVIDGKRLKRKKSISSASLHKNRHCNGSYLEIQPEQRGKDMSGSSKGKEAVPGRSLSLSDLGLVPPPVENGLREMCNGAATESEDSLFMEDATERIKGALQLVCLLLPPASRRRLHLLLRLMSKIANNDQLTLDPQQPARNLLLDTFHRAILCCHDESDMDELLVVQVVAFLMDHYTDILSVPLDLKTEVEQQITKLQRTKVRYSSDDSTSLHYCKQVSLTEYENQRLSTSQQALASLLDELIMDKNMPAKHKKKRLKQFQKIYPEIYQRRFQVEQSDSQQVPVKPKIKQPLLTKPLLKLKGLRL